MLMSFSERLLYMGQEYSFVHTKENVMDFIEQIPTWPWQAQLCSISYHLQKLGVYQIAT